MNEDVQTIFRIFLAGRRRIICGWLGQMGSAAESLSRLGKKVNTKDKKYSRMRPKASSECKTERVKDRKINLLKK